MNVPVVGLTGGIASGKSTVARAFGRLGLPVVDADQLAREVVEPGTDGLRDIVSWCGEGILLEDGTLDRKALGALVFADPEARRKLNAITHPRIAMLAAERIRTLGTAGVPYVLYEAALIVENGMHRAMHALVVVAADEQTQLARLIGRDQLSEADARARMAAQYPLADKVRVADYVIDNSGSHESLTERVCAVHQALLTRLGKTS